MAGKKTPELNSSSSADIAFLLLCYFLMTTTMNQDSGLQRRLPPLPDESQKEETKQEVNRHNVIEVKVNKQDQLLIGQEPIDISVLKERIKEGLTNPNNSKDLPDKKKDTIKVDGKVVDIMISQGIISLQNHNFTSYKRYIEVQNELMKAINELRDEFAMAYFKKPYQKLDKAGQAAVRKAVPNNLSEGEPSNAGEENN